MLNNLKIKEMMRYLIVGVLTTILSLAIYFGLTKTILNPDRKLELQIANILSWFFSVLFAYFANRQYVFQSKDKHILKESLSFFSSRVLTLILDMVIMFLGVSVLRFNDKIVKLVSQIVIIILNYVLSKLFVFQKKDKKYFLAIKPYYFYALPLLDFLNMFWVNNKAFLILSLSYRVFLFILLGLYAFKKKHYYFLLFLGSYLSIQILYLYCQSYLTLMSIISLLDIFLLPLVLISLKKGDLKDISEDFFYNLFYLYSFLFLLNLIFFKQEMFSLYPVLGLLILHVVSCLFNHKNYLMKILSFLLLFSLVLISKSLVLVLALFFAILLSFKKKDWKVWFLLCLITLLLGIYGLFHSQNTSWEKIFFDNRLTDMSSNYDFFQNANIEERLFGIYSIKDLDISKVNIDFMDIFLTLGYIGSFVYIVLMLMALKNMKYKGKVGLIYLYTILISFFAGQTLNNFSYLLLMGLYLKVYPLKKEKRILLISNMYPSLKYPHYGSFVKNCKVMLEKASFKVDTAVKYKQDSFIGKLLGYTLLYIQAIFKSLWYSYDYYYVHFTSQNAYSPLLGKWTGKTKLICNVHGNDIVPDYDYERKNVSRSQIILKYADKVVCPSSYFKEVLLENYQVPLKKIVVFPSGGVDLTIFKKEEKKEALKKLQLNDNRIYYGMVSRLEKDKGWDTLLNVLGRLKKEGRLNKIKLLVVGSGSEEELFKKAVKKNKLQEEVILKPFVTQSELVSYYNAMDLFVFPTKRKSESLGLVGLEAMACKTFVIGCDLYGPKEYLKNKKNSLTFKTEDELYAALLKYQSMSTNEKEKIIKNASKTVLDYDVTLMEERIKQIFKNN